VDEQRARELLDAERARVERLISDSEAAAREDRDSVDEPDGLSDPAEPLTSEGTADAVVESLRDRLAAIDRAEKRLDAGTYGRSIRSGQVIPDDRLEADPAAELTVEEAAAG
jgi:DnaK suppressor protein